MLEPSSLHSLEVHLSFRGRNEEAVYGPADEHPVFAVDRECPIPACQRLGIRLRGNQRNSEIDATCGFTTRSENQNGIPWLMEGSPWQRIFPAISTRISQTS